MILPPEGHQPFASPGEALAHFGVKGMRWGFRKERDPSFETFGQPYSAKDNAHGEFAELRLKKDKLLRVDRSEGFAHVRSARGFKSEQSRKNYESVLEEFRTARETYPKIKELKVEVVPMSHFPGWTPRGVQAAVIHGKPGEVIITYNDRSKDISPRSQKAWASWVPGMAYPGYAGRHEMGHVLASAAQTLPSTSHMYAEKSFAKRMKDLDDYNTKTEQLHKDKFAKHGLTFEELGKLGNYAKTSPSEAYAEAYGNYHTSELRAKMSPQLQAKVKALLDDEGGVK